MLLALAVSIGLLEAQQTKRLRIRILEQGIDEPVISAEVKYHNQTVRTDPNGYCMISYLGERQIRLTIKATGFEPINARSYAVRSITTPLIVRMKMSGKMLGQLAVDGHRKHSSILQQSVSIDKKALERNTSISIGKLLEQVPGVSTLSTGGTIVKPVIQGMHSSRILLVNNGVRLESQSWGADHAPEIDHTGASVVEVIKGAEAIRYGYGAVGGVVLFNQAPLPFGSDKLSVAGKLNTGYATNASAYDGAGSLEVGYKQLGMRLHGMYQKAGDYRTAEYILNNTGYNNISLSGQLGFKNHRIAATLFSSLYYSRSGIYYASQISDINQLLARFQAGRPAPETFHPFSYKIEPPFQQSQHFTLKGEVQYDLAKAHQLSLKLSYQDNLRQEFENRKQANISWLPVQDLQLTTYAGDLTWTGKWKLWNMNTQAGLSGMYQYNYNIPGTKQPAFIPNYAALTLGGFATHKLTIKDLQLSVGMRYDIRALDVNGYTSLSSFKYYEDFKLFRNVTGSLAAFYQLTKHLDLRANVGWSWRPPDINELYATGLHHGTYWVVGNKELDSERGYKAVFGAKYHLPWLVVEPSFFYQEVDNYIYDNIGKGLNRFHNHPSGKYPKFIYEQDNARFYGGDCVLTLKPMEQLSFTAKGEWIYARNLTQDTWLPFMPSDRYTLEGDYQFAFGSHKRWHGVLSLEGIYVTKQTRFDPEKDLVPDSPPAYALLNATAELGYDYASGKTIKVMLLGDNILNALYKDYTDRFRYYAHAMGAKWSLRTVINF